jgi:ribonuclease HII
MKERLDGSVLNRLTMTTKQRKAKNTYERERRRLHRLHRYEQSARERGFQLVGGVDEVGRGPLAGPVVAACVVAREPLMLPGLNDSKVVPAARRCELAAEIRARATAYGIGVASVAEIDRINIYWASVLAMERAIAALHCGPPEYLFTDAVRIRSFAGPQEPLVKGDALCAVIAAASIVAKVYRDELLAQLDREDPRYGFADHKGYATPAHIAALRMHGPSIHHRAAFARVREAQLELLFAADSEAEDDGEFFQYEPQGAPG